MPPKKSPFVRKTSFQEGFNPLRFKGAPGISLEEVTIRSRPKSRLVKSVSHVVLSELSHEEEKPSLEETLRPRRHSMPPPTTTSSSQMAENWIVDENKLFESFNSAIKEHDTHAKMIKGSNKGHSAVFQKLMDRRVGFGVVVQFKCNHPRCTFQSSQFDLFEKLADGGVKTNLQAGTAMAKSDITPTKLEFLSTVLNVKPPSRATLQKQYNVALEASEPLAEKAMAENRGVVYKLLQRKGKVEEGVIPEVEASTDGQYSLRSYHTPTGHSQSASIPVIENETGAGLLIQHSALSRRDGSLKTHINTAEHHGGNINYTKTYKAERFPLALQTMTIDGDASVRKGFEKGVTECGESRPFKTRACSQHGSKAAARKFLRESLKPLTKEQKKFLGEGSSKSVAEEPEMVDSNTCPQCRNVFKSARGVAVHRRSCAGLKADGGTIGLEPLFFTLANTGNALLSAEKKVFRNGVRVWLLARMKREFYSGLTQLNPGKTRVENDSHIKSRLMHAGQTIVKCIQGNHDCCQRDSFVCPGEGDPASYSSLPYGVPLHNVPSSVSQWLLSIVECMLGSDSLNATVINGRAGTTSLVESAHHEIRKTVPKGLTHKRNESKLIKSGVCQC